MVSCDFGVGYCTGMRLLSRGGGDAPPIVVAHRGASRRALENSLEAFSLSLADRADMIEFDVRLSAEGEPVVIHDPRTGRTARENVPVDRTGASRLRRIRLQNGEPIPFLADVLGLVRGAVPVNIETKTAGGVRAALRVIGGMGYRGEILLSSGLRDECLAARTARPGVPCGLVTGRPSASDLAFCLRHSLSSIHPDHRKLSVLRIRKVKESGLPLLPYTVDDEEVFFRLVEGGVDGVFSNRAEELRAAWRVRFHGGE
ncbi:MAG TPA: glycerophosphodiester phosphodiesterase [Candidatus Deferrimicrobiaceae bacterium]|nr:glycerophosphodiester phosphodiesterase [Candidatus Deferrimicrobiaceae bacterium]